MDWLIDEASPWPYRSVSEAVAPRQSYFDVARKKLAAEFPCQFAADRVFRLQNRPEFRCRQRWQIVCKPLVYS
jgi:hypothetical protein